MRDWRGFALWVAFALLVRAGAGAVFAEALDRAFAVGIGWDARIAYLPLAEGLLERGEYAIHPGEPEASHVPGYPVLLAGLMALSGRSAAALRPYHAAFGALAVGLLFLLATRLEARRVAHATAFAAALFPDLVAYSLLPLTETPYLVCWLLASLFMLQALRTRRAAPAAGVGLSLAAALMLREATVALAAVWGAFLLARRQPEGRRWGPALTVWALVLAVLLPWWVRNWVALGEFVPLTTKGASSLYQGTQLRPYPVTDERNTGLPLDPAQAAREADVQRRKEAAASASERDAILLEAALDNLRRDPVAQLLHVGRKLIWLWSPNIGPRHTRVGPALALWTAATLHYAVLALGLLGLWLRRRQRETAIVLILPLVLFTLLHLFVGGAEPRYHFSSWPALLIGACVALDELRGRAAGRLQDLRKRS